MKRKNNTFWAHIDSKIETLCAEGRQATAGNYGRAKRCLWRYCPNKNLTLEDITPEFIVSFNRYLEGLQIKSSTVSFYNRALRSLYNQAVKDGYIRNLHPFDQVNTAVDTRLTPVKLKIREDQHLEDLSKDDLLKQYRSLQKRYNTLVYKLTSVVGI